MQVYGELVEDVDEDCQIKPKNIYGLTHALSEQICSFFNQTNTNVLISG